MQKPFVVFLRQYARERGGQGDARSAQGDFGRPWRGREARLDAEAIGDEPNKCSRSD